jgi:hypothetical protein
VTLEFGAKAIDALADCGFVEFDQEIRLRHIIPIIRSPAEPANSNSIRFDHTPEPP